VRAFARAFERAPSVARERARRDASGARAGEVAAGSSSDAGALVAVKTALETDE